MILGDVDHSVIENCDPSQKERLTHIFDKTKYELNKMQMIFESFGIKVHRPGAVVNGEIKTPYWNSKGIKIPLTPRDVILTLGNTVVETASWQKERMFETFYYRDILLSTNSSWISMPLPRHNYNGIEADIVPDQDPILDAPAVLKYGKDLFISAGGSHNQLGVHWLQNCFPEYRVHQMHEPFVGHLDSHITLLRPGLLMTYHDPALLPKFFQDWQVIQVNPKHDKSMSKNQTLVDHKIQDDDFDNTVLAVNTLSVDRNTVVMYDHYKDSTYVLDQFAKHNIKVVFVKLTYSHFFNQGVTCITNDLVRDTEGLIDYT